MVDKATAHAGDVVTYTITVTNQSTATAAASNVDITDTVPAATLAHLTALTAQDGGVGVVGDGDGEAADGGELGAGCLGDGAPAGDPRDYVPDGEHDADEHRGGDESG